MRSGFVASLLLAVVAVTAESQVPKPTPQPPSAKSPATRPAGAAAVADVEVLKYPLLPPAAHWGLRYLARSQYTTGGWGQKFGFLQPDLDLINGRIGKQKLRDPAGAVARYSDEENVRGPLAFDKKVLIKPSAVVDTSLVTLAFLEAGRSPARGDGARQLRRAIDFVYDAVGPGAAAPRAPGLRRGRQLDLPRFGRDELPPFSATSGRLHTPALGDALALELFLATLDRTIDPALRSNLNFAIGILVRRIETAQQDDGGWGAGGVLTRVADALVTRSLMIAARRGVPVDPTVIDRARQACLIFYDPATGEAGDQSDLAFVQCAMTLDVLYQTEQSARVAAEDARRRAAARAATPAQIEEARARDAELKAARDALAVAVDRFYEKLFKSNRPVAKPRAKAVTANALPATRPANPLDTAAKEPEMREVGIPVPVSHENAVAYFMLLEALQESTHPLARPLTDGIVNALAGKQDRFGQWHIRIHPEGMKMIGHKAGFAYEDMEDHFLTGWVVRAILLPAPPAPEPKK
jgi:hypothetical protein